MITYRNKRLLFCAALAVTAILPTTPLVAASCENLSGMKFSGSRITAAEIVPAGAFTPPGDAPNASTLATKEPEA